MPTQVWCYTGVECQYRCGVNRCREKIKVWCDLVVGPMMAQVVLEVALTHQLHYDQCRLTLRHYAVELNHVATLERSVKHQQVASNGFYAPYKLSYLLTY